MKTKTNPFIRSTSIATSFVLALGMASAADLYWDTNGTTEGVGAGTGIWGTDNFWTTDPLGLASTGAYIAGSDVFFSAGTDAGTFTTTVAAGSNQQAASLTFQEGTTTLSGTSLPLITLTGSGGNITVNGGASGIIGAGSSLALGGSVGLGKLGTGTLTLNGSDSHPLTGGVRVLGGTLALNLANMPGSPANMLAASNSLTLGGGTLALVGKAGFNTSQAFAGTNVNSGNSIVAITANTTGFATTAALGTISQSQTGGVISIQTGTGGTPGTTLNIATVSNPAGLIAPWAIAGDSRTGASRWASVNGSGQIFVVTGAAQGTNMASVTSGSVVYTIAGNSTLGASATAFGLQDNDDASNTVTLGNFNITTNGLSQIRSIGRTRTFAQGSGTGRIIVGPFNELVGAGSGSLTIGVPIVNGTGGNSNVTYAGGGVFRLTAASTFSGQLTANSGTVQVDTGGSVNSASGIRINGGRLVQTNTTTAMSPVVSLVGGAVGGTIDGTGTINTVNVSDLAANKLTNGNGGTGALTIGDLTFSGDAAIDVRTAGSAGLQVTGTLTTTPANGQVVVNVTSNPLWVTGTTYNLISFGTLAGSIGDFTKGNVPGLGARQSADLVLNGANIGLSITGDSARWTGQASSEWTTDTLGSPFNWKTLAGNTGTEFLTGDDVVFDDTATNTNVDISTAGVSVNTATFNNSTTSYTITSSFGHGIVSGTLIKNGSNSVLLASNNTYTGGTLVNAGTLEITGGNALADTGLVTLANTAGATFRVSGTETIGALAGGGGAGGTVSIDAGQILTLTSGTQTYSGTISGDGALTSLGALQTLNGPISISGGLSLAVGRLFLGGNSSYTGPTNISSGAGLVITANNALGAGGTGNETLIAGTGTALSGAIGLSGGITYSTNETIIGAGVGNTAANGEFASVQRGIIQSIAGNNTFAGDIEVNSTGITRFGTQTGAGIALTLSGRITLVPGASILIRAGGTDGNFVTLSNPNNSWDQDISVFTDNANPAQSAGLRLGADNALVTTASVGGALSTAAATTFDMAGFNQTLNGLAGAAQLNISNSNSSQQSVLTLENLSNKATNQTTILDGAGTIRLVKKGDFTQTLARANNYSGTTTIEDGQLLFARLASLYNGNAASWTKENIIVNPGATLGLRVGGTDEFTVGDVSTIIGNLTSGISNNGLQGGSFLNLEVNSALTISTVIANSSGTGSGSLGLIKTGTTTLTLDQNNPYSGGTWINGGFLVAANNGALGGGGVTIGGNGIRLMLSNGLTLANAITLESTAGSVGNGLLQNRNQAAGENATFSGPITITAPPLAGGHFGSAGTGSTLTITGSITASSRVLQRVGTVIFSGGGSYAEFGITGTTRLGADNGLSTNAVAFFGESGSAVLDLAGFSQSLAGITRIANTATIGNSSTSADSTLTITGTSTYDGLVQDSVGGGTRKLNLVMNGAGQTLTLTGSTTHTGTTSVAAGTLSLGNGTANTNLANGADIIVAGSATLNLNYSAANVDVVDTLTINGVQKAAGIWGAPGSGAPNTDPQITGTGFLDVQTGPSGNDYDDWLSLYPSLTGDNRLPASDPDGDGLANFEEYAFGLNPTLSSSVNPVSQPLDKGTGQFKYTRRATPAATGVTYSYQSSTTLAGAWSGFVPVSAVSNNASPVEEITVTIPSGLLENSTLFIQVKAVQP